ncbi:MAG: hypothetical protein WA996_12785, partial [Candidatus Promineifilaceae bacterium]
GLGNRLADGRFLVGESPPAILNSAIKMVGIDMIYRMDTGSSGERQIICFGGGRRVSEFL